MRAAVRCATPRPSPNMMMMFLTLPLLKSLRCKATTSKLPRAVTVWPSLCVAVTLKLCTPGCATVKARSVAMLALVGTLATQPLLQPRSATGRFSAMLSMAKRTSRMVLLGSSGRNVACMSKRWPGKKRAMMGAACWLLNSSLGGVKRLTVGAAVAVVGVQRFEQRIAKTLVKKVEENTRMRC